MKFFIDTASVQEIREAAALGLLDGVTTNPSLLSKEKLKAGLELRLDPNQRVAVEVIGSAKRIDRSLTRVEPILWSDIGGQHVAEVCLGAGQVEDRERERDVRERVADEGRRPAREEEPELALAERAGAEV